MLHHKVMETSVYPQSEHQKVVGVRLRRLIDFMGITYVEAAELMGVTKQVLRNWMAGASYPAPFALYKLCRSKGVNFDYVFLGDWSNLPHHLAKEFDRDLAGQMGPSQGEPEAEAQTGGGNS